MNAPNGRPAGGDDVATVVAALRDHGRAIADELVQVNAHRWEAASVRDRERIEEVSRWIVDRLLSAPAERAAQLEDDDQAVRAEALRELFGLGGRPGLGVGDEPTRVVRTGSPLAADVTPRASAPASPSALPARPRSVSARGGRARRVAPSGSGRSARG